MSLMINITATVDGYDGQELKWDLHEALSGALVQTKIEVGTLPGNIHASTMYITFADVRDITYNVRLYKRDPGGLWQFVKSYECSVNSYTVDIVKDYELVVGGSGEFDPVADTTEIAIPPLAGKNIRVRQRLVGQLLQFRDPEIEVLEDGGFKLLNGLTFTESDVYIVEADRDIHVNPPGSVGGSGSVIIIEEDYNLSAADFNKEIIVNTVNPVVEIQLPPLADVALDRRLKVSVTNQTNVVIKANGIETINVYRQDRANVTLGGNESVDIIRVNTLSRQGFFASVLGELDRVGQLDWASYYDGNTNNRLLANRQTIFLPTYPRLRDAILSGRCGAVKTFAEEFTADADGNFINRFYFLVSGNNCKLPDWRGHYMKFTQDGRAANSFEKYSVGDHEHYAMSDGVPADGGDAPVSGTQYVRRDHSFSSNLSYRMKGSLTLSDVGKTGGVVGAAEGNEVNNGGLIPLIIV